MFSLNWQGIEGKGPDYLYLAQEMRDAGFPVEHIVDALETLDRTGDVDGILNTYREERENVDA